MAAFVGILKSNIPHVLQEKGCWEKYSYPSGLDRDNLLTNSRALCLPLYANKMEYLLKITELDKYFKKADFTDVKVFEGETIHNAPIHITREMVFSAVKMRDAFGRSRSRS